MSEVKEDVDLTAYDPVMVFRSMINGEHKLVQNFFDGKAGRRVYSKTDTAGTTEFYVRGLNGDEEWVITTKNLNQGIWVPVPEPNKCDYFGTVLTGLINGDYDYIRNENWENTKMYLAHRCYQTGEGLYDCFINTMDNTIFQPSMSSFFTKTWIGIKLPKV